MLNDDFKPYILKSSDKGKTWTPIIHKLPANRYYPHISSKDNVNPDLLFAGSEILILYFSIDGGNEWIEFKSGLPYYSMSVTLPYRSVSAIGNLEHSEEGFMFRTGLFAVANFKKEILDKDGIYLPVKDRQKCTVQTRGF